MLNQRTLIAFTGILFILFAGCNTFEEKEIYKRPEWLPGKLYTTISVNDKLTMFAECIKLSGLDTIINVSGSWCVFAPSNEAMKDYLLENQYANISEIPIDKLERLVEFHIVQSPWSFEQLQSLSAFGWRTGSGNDEWYSHAYKRQTILKNPVEKYWIKKEKNLERIVLDSSSSKRYKKVFVQSRKNVPIFYDDYVNINGITSADYSFYFDRAYEQGNVYFAGARIIEADISAENGFVHIIDKVVKPMSNAKEILEREELNESYNLFLEMVYWYYPSFEPNMTATNNQPAIRTGGVADTLFDLNYPNLAFVPHAERIGFEGSDVNETFAKHNGLVAPTNRAFKKFIDDILTVKSGFPHWRDHKSLPRDVYDIIVSSQFLNNPIYPSTDSYKRIFKWKNGFNQDEGDIIRKEFGSNCTFIGINSYTPDKVFTSVTGPVFLRSNYSLFRQALLYCDIEDDISYKNDDLYFFPIPDNALKADSSLILTWVDRDKNKYKFMEFNRKTEQIQSISKKNLKKRILNHVGTPVSSEDGNKELIKTLGGNYITWDHSNNTIKGKKPSTIGYNGITVTTCNPVPLDEPADNGKAWSVNYWFNF